MRHCRTDYEAIQPFPTARPHVVKIDGETTVAGDAHLGRHMDPIIPDDEPVFLLRACDAVAPAAVRAWADLAELIGADYRTVARVREWAVEMEEYAASHDRHVPDTPAEHLTSA